MTYTYKLSERVLEALRIKAAKIDTTPEGLLDKVVEEFCLACECESVHKRRNKIISKIVSLKSCRLDELEKFVNRLADDEVE